MSFPIGDYFSEPLRDLGRDTPSMHGIWMPESEIGRTTSGCHGSVPCECSGLSRALREQSPISVPC